METNRHKRPQVSVDEQFEDAPVPTILPIYPSQGLFVLVFAGDGNRFVKLFKRTWRKIPKQERDLLLEQWKAERDFHSAHNPNMKWPRIALRKTHHVFDRSQAQRRISFGSTSSIDITFYAPTFAIMPDDVFCIVIAHELAHRVMRLEDPKLKPPRGLGKVYRAHEDKVNKRIGNWGLDPEATER